MRDDEGSPDGMTVDAEGCLWVALWGAGAVRRYHPDGHLLHTLTVTAPHPTSVCLPPTQSPVRHHGPPRGEEPDRVLRRGARLPGAGPGNGGLFLAGPALRLTT
ncbi:MULTISPECIES: SMP-30/gluconolactonase/LRE family protein [Streptomyces]